VPRAAKRSNNGSDGGRGWGRAAAAALALATSRTLWPQSVIAEVYGLQLLFAAAIAYVLAARPGGKYSLWPPAFIAGLAMTHHTTILFSIAAGAIAVMDQYRRRLLDIRLIICRSIPRQTGAIRPPSAVLSTSSAAPRTTILSIEIAPTRCAPFRQP
jgi:Protein of unknown function (DUF2723)